MFLRVKEESGAYADLAPKESSPALPGPILIANSLSTSRKRCRSVYDDGNPHEPAQNLLIFHGCGLGWGFPPEAIREVVPMGWLVAPLGLPSALAGFLDLRGSAIPI